MQIHEPHDSDDWLEHALRSDASEHRTSYLADQGFTERVMAQLPRPATLPAWRRPAIAALWLIAAVAGIIALPGLFDDAFRAAVALLLRHRVSLFDLAMAFLLLGAAAWSGLIYAMRGD